MRIDQAFAQLAENVINNGYLRPSRAGDTVSLPGQHLSTRDIVHEFPILSSRKIFHNGVLGELAAFIRGATDLATFRAFNCNYWDYNAGQWVHNVGLEMSDWQVGKIYGYQWRHWGPTEIDQLSKLVEGIQKDPYGRRHILTTWNPTDLDDMCLPPCHILAQFYVRNVDKRLDCMVYMRSVDIALGLPSDLVLYGALLMLVAQFTGFEPGALHYSFGDAHVYTKHLEQLRDEQLPRCKQLACSLPQATLSTTVLEEFKPSDFTLLNYNGLEVIKYDLL